MRMFEAAIGAGIGSLFLAGRQLVTGVVGAGNRSGQVRDNVVILSWCLRGEFTTAYGSRADAGM